MTNSTILTEMPTQIEQHQPSAKVYSSMHAPRPSIRRIVLFPLELFFVAHVGLAIYIAGFTLAFSVVQPPFGSLMLYRWIHDGVHVKPIIPVPISEIKPNVRDMFIRLEDNHFYHHHGIDLGAIRAAYEIDKRVGRYVRGGSTIDMQLARTLFLTVNKNLYRKYVEAFIAVEMDALLPKSRILSLYLNSIEWGRGVFGIGQASFFEYGKPYTSLTDDQIRRLAAILPSPLQYTVHDFYRDPGLYDRYELLVRLGY